MTNSNLREFQKYKTRGAYHWEQIGYNLVRRNAFVLGRYNNVIRLLEQKVGLLDGVKVLDVGCGDGVLSYLIAKKNAAVSGLDYSEIAIEFAKEKIKEYSIDFKRGSAYELPFEDDCFDAVVSSDVIEHLEDVPRYLSEIRRVLKDGGVAVISTPIKCTEHPLDKEHVVEWFQDEYKSVIEKQFSASDFYYSHPLALQEIYSYLIFRKPWPRLLMNILSLVINPFNGFASRFKYKVLQYSVSQVKK